MVLRCYSRRHVVPAGRAARQTAVPASAPIPVRVTARSTRSYETTPYTRRGSASKDQQDPDALPFHALGKPGDVGPSQHPIKQRLISELTVRKRPTMPNRIWELYVALKDATLAESITGGPSPQQIDGKLYQWMVRAVDPFASRSIWLTDAVKKHVSSSAELEDAIARGGTPDKIHFVSPPSIRHGERILRNVSRVRSYMLRIHTLFRDMRRFSKESRSVSRTEAFPGLDDYNHVLSRLAPGGHIAPMSSLWNDMERTSSTPLAPNQATYKQLMIGLTRHAQKQILKFQTREAATIHPLKYRSRSTQDKFDSVLAPNSRAAAVLAGLRAIALLEDMKVRGVAPCRMTVDFAARSLRLAGSLEGLKVLLRQAYGIDLGSPDAQSGVAKGFASARPSVHTLNTVLMALGEQATVPEMITAYETLSKPLPVPDNKMNSALVHDTQPNTPTMGILDHFRSSWSEAFSSQEAGSAANEDAQSSARLPPQRLHPNSKTFEILVKHCIRSVNVLRSPAPLQTKLGALTAGMGAARYEPMGPRQLEMNKRDKGKYLLFARALITEALERSDISLQHRARNLGIDIMPAQAATELTDQPKTDQLSAEASADDLKIDDGPERPRRETPRPEHFAFDAVAGRACEPDFVPMLEQVHFAVTSHMLEAYYSNTSQRKVIVEMEWVKEALEKALTNKLTEINVLDAALHTYKSRLDQTKRQAKNTPVDTPKPTRANDEDEEMPLPPLKLESQKRSDVVDFLRAIKRQRQWAAKQAQGLEELLYDRLVLRMQTIRERRSENRQIRKLEEAEARLEQEREALYREKMVQDRQRRLDLERKAKKERSILSEDETEHLDPAAAQRW